MTFIRERLNILGTIKVPGNISNDMDADDDGDDDFEAFDDLVSVVSIASSVGSITKSNIREIKDVYDDNILVYNNNDISSSLLSPTATKSSISLQGFSNINVWARERLLLSSSLTSLKYPGPGILVLGLFLPADDAGVALPIIASSGKEIINYTHNEN